MEVGDKGVCRLGIVPVRGEASDKAELVTQLLFGDHYELVEISINRKWIKVKMYFDQYEGWIDTKQHTNISEAYFNQINNSDYKICTDLTSSILFNKNQINIVIGSVLPIATNEIFKIEEQLAFNGEAKSLSQKREIEFLKEIAKKYLNAPYLWGGRSPFGIDCSGFVQSVFKICGYKLPRDASQQVGVGQLIENISESMAGDLAFFCNEEGVVNHVGIILEENQIIHASGKVRIDTVDDKGILSNESNSYSHHLISIHRIIKH